MSHRDLLKLLPSVDQMLRKPEVRDMIKTYTRPVVTKAIRNVLERTRRGILEDDGDRLISVPLTDVPVSSGLAAPEQPADVPASLAVPMSPASPASPSAPGLEKFLIGALVKELRERDLVNLKEVINGTGVVIHTNLGRSPMAKSVASDISRLAGRYLNLEYDLKNGKRGSRHDIAKDFLCSITGAEDCLVVNNNAAAVLLVLSTMASGREVIVSRGELVEIGGSFRVPEVMEQGGAKLVEVGTTNKTYAKDYERAIGDDTALLLKVHTSNYRICGFTDEVSRDELADIGKRYNLPVVEDLGSGVLVDLSEYKVGNEPTVQASIATGIDIVTFSGDKLLGGPQAGIIAGKAEYIKRITKHPLARAMRVDRLVLLALQSTLRIYMEDKGALGKIPVLEMLTMPPKKLKARANRLLELLRVVRHYADINIEKEYSQVGGGSMPLERLETYGLKIKPQRLGVKELDDRLRFADIPVLGRIIKDRYFIDVRTVFDEQLPVLAEMLTLALTGGDGH